MQCVRRGDPKMPNRRQSVVGRCMTAASNDFPKVAILGTTADASTTLAVFPLAKFWLKA
jgi:hypothetical protein